MTAEIFNTNGTGRVDDEHQGITAIRIYETNANVFTGAVSCGPDQCSLGNEQGQPGKKEVDVIAAFKHADDYLSRLTFGTNYKKDCSILSNPFFANDIGKRIYLSCTLRKNWFMWVF